MLGVTSDYLILYRHVKYKRKNRDKHLRAKWFFLVLLKLVGSFETCWTDSQTG